MVSRESNLLIKSPFGHSMNQSCSPFQSLMQAVQHHFPLPPTRQMSDADEEGRPHQRPLRKPTADSRPMILILSFPLFIPSPQLCPREALSMGGIHTPRPAPDAESSQRGREFEGKGVSEPLPDPEKGRAGTVASRG